MENKLDSKVELVVTSEEYQVKGRKGFLIRSYQDEEMFYKITNRIQEKIYKEL